MMKNYTFIVLSLFSFYSLQTKDCTDISDASMIIINDIADITDDLASLIIACKHDKNPESIKVLLVSLLKNIAKTSPNVKQLIDSIKATKQKRSSTSTETLEQLALEEVADNILNKADIKE